MNNYIPPGYKKTEIGIIPEDWEVKKLVDAIGNKNSNIVAGPFGSNLKVEDYVDNGIPLIRLQNIGENKFIEKDIKYISNEKAKKLNYHSFKSGDLVLAKLGDPLGKTCMIPNKIRYGIVVADVVRIRIESVYADAKFIMYILNHTICRRQLNNDVIGSTRPRVNLNKVRSLLIPLPPLPEQKAIARVLSDVDKLIENLDKLIEKKKNIKKGAMQELLTGKKRLPGFEGEWVRKKLGEIVSIFKGQGLSKFKLSDNGKYPCILYGELFTTYKEVIKEVKSRTNYPEGVPSKYGDILFPSSTTTKGIDLANASALLKDNVLLGGDIIILRSIEKFNSIFLAYYLNEVKKYDIAERTYGITIYHLYGKDLAELEVFLPPSIDEQNAIAQILSDMDAEIEALERKKEKYEMIKKGMMHLLLTGKVRLKDKVEEVLK